jgi:hypothetical protein
MHTKLLSENLKGRDCLEDEIRMDLRETYWKCMDWMHLVQDRDQ